MALHLIPIEEVRTACRQKVESCELWLRRLIFDALQPEFGNDFVATSTVNGQSAFRMEIRKHAEGRLAAQPKRYSRPIDALQLDHLTAVICKSDMYEKYFRKAFQGGFPTGREHVRLYLTRLVEIRNSLSHANPISIHDAERALCYSDDIISSLVSYYEDMGKKEDFDAPSFTRFSDSLGNMGYPSSTIDKFDFTTGGQLRPGDYLRCEVEVDSHYSPDEYTVRWVVANISGGESSDGSTFTLLLQARHVGTEFAIVVVVMSKKDWHRHSNFDAHLVVTYRVLPPLSQ